MQSSLILTGAGTCVPATSIMRFRTFLPFSTVPLRSTSGHSESSRILTAAHGPVSHPGLMPISAQQSSGNMISIAFLRSTQHNKTNKHTDSSEIIIVKTLTRTKYRAYIRSVQTTLQGRHRPSLHQFVRQARIRNVSREIPSLTTGTQQAAKATALNAQFASVTRPDDPLLSIPPILTPSEASACFTSVITTTATVRRHLKKLPTCKASGPDGITNRVLKALAPSIAFPLCHIFNMSFTTGIFPSAWKTAKVIPVFKKGSRNEPANHRPISLLPCVSKVCERIFYDHLYRHVSPFLSPAQSGFRKGDSTSLQLTRIVQQVCQHRDNRALAGICFFDLAKAFDTVWHRGPLAKLEHAFRVRKQPLSWLKSYLSGRYQYVTLLGTSSAAEPVLSGVSQGSILGPLLFIVYVNDLPATSLFADDTTILT